MASSAHASTEVVTEKRVESSLDVVEVSRLSWQGFNDLPSLDDAVTWMENHPEFSKVLENSLGPVLIKHGVSLELLVSLNHMHYKLQHGEYQVTRILTTRKEKIVSDNFDDIVFASSDIDKTDQSDKKTDENSIANQEHEFDETEFFASPVKCDFEKDGLIPMKWRYNKEKNCFESYEYFAANIENASEYCKVVQNFEESKELQRDLAQALIQNGPDYVKYFGLVLQYIPTFDGTNGAAVEINHLKDRESKMLVIRDENYRMHPKYIAIKNSKSVETSWQFYQIGLENGSQVSKSMFKGKCKSHCGTHCYHLCVVCRMSELDE